MTNPNHLIDRFDVLSAELAENGDTLIQIGDAQSGEVESSNVRMWVGDGFLGIPNVPSSDGNAQVLGVLDGNEVRATGSRDRRFVNAAGALEPGDRAIVSDSEARFLLKREDDNITLYSVNQKTDESMMVSIHGKNGELQVINGKSFINLRGDAISIGVSGGPIITIDKDGVKIGGKALTVNTESVALGNGATIPVLTGTPATPKPSGTVFVPPF